MRKLFLTVLLSLCFGSVTAGELFNPGPLIDDYGKHAAVEHSSVLNKNTHLKVVFDLQKRAGDNGLNSKFETLARLLNMHVANGVPAENIQLAVVVHSKAGLDLLNNKAYNKMANMDNPNHDLLKQLMANNVDVYICGQSATYMQISNSDLIEGIQMSLSALTAHALLQQDGYTLNPF